jgi:ferredoxin-NADP reductase
MAMAEADDAVRRHGFHRLRVKSVVRETEDTRSFVLDVPADLRDAFGYRAGQFCTFRIHLDGEEHSRCYSMSSAPETEDDLTVTVKRVPGGVVSNWLNDHVAEGDELEVTRPSGNFCVRNGERPIVGFCGGSGVTPVISIARSVLASTSRPVRLFYANRDRDSVIFDDALRELSSRHPDRLEIHHHLDTDAGLVDPAAVSGFVGDGLDADFYLCGPGPFMDVVESALLDLGAGPDAIFVERFVTPAQADDATAGDEAATDGAAGDVPDEIVVILKGQRQTLPYHPGDTVLATARRSNVATPYSCEAGNCATCMALVREGAVEMRVNDALDDDEVADGWVLTCQSRPVTPTLVVEFEPL